MRRFLPVIPLIGLVITLSWSVFGQTDSRTYSHTRKLLLKMERTDANATMKKLFEEGIKRKEDLIRAVDDDEQKVSVNAQVIINYLSDAEMLDAITQVRQKRISQNKSFWSPKIELATEKRLLRGKDKDPAKLVLRNLYSEKDFRATLIGYNKMSNTALIEVVSGGIFTEGYHVSLRKEGDDWLLLSNNLIWQH